VEGGGWRVEGGGWRVEGCRTRHFLFEKNNVILVQRCQSEIKKVNIRKGSHEKRNVNTIIDALAGRPEGGAKLALYFFWNSDEISVIK
jgi:hypothetical protein